MKIRKASEAIQENFNEKSCVLKGFIYNEIFIPNGEVLIRHSSGNVELKGQYLHGKAIGEWLRYFENGNLQSMHKYVDGKLHGTYEHYLDNGMIALRSTWYYGVLDKRTIIYNDSGKIEKEFRYNKGQLLKAKIKYGSKNLEFDLMNEKLSVPWKTTHAILCFVEKENKVVCKTPFQLWKDLSTTMSPEDLQLVFEFLNRIQDENGLGTGGGVLTSCGGGFVSTEMDSDSFSRGTDSHAVELSTSEMEAVIEACRNRLDDSLSANGVNPMNRRDQGVQDAINQIDDAVANCQDTTSTMFADGGASAGTIIGAGGLVLATAVAIGQAATYYYEKFVQEKGWEGRVETRPGVFVSTRVGDPNTTKEEDTVNHTITITEPGSEKYNNAGGKIITTKDTESNNSTVKYTDADGTIIRTDNFDSTNKIVTSEQIQPDGSTSIFTYHYDPNGNLLYSDEVQSAPSTGQGVDLPVDGESSNCEKLASKWSLIKEQCELTNWQTYDCKDALRIITGCMDTTEVYPTDEGVGLGCRHSKDSKSAHEYHCEKQKLIAMPSGFGSFSCKSIDSAATFERGIDICNDPRAMCNPDDILMGGRFRQNLLMKPKASFNQKDSTLTFSMPIPKAEKIRNYSKIKQLNDLNFDKHMNQNNTLNLVVFSSKNCGPCLKLLDIFESESLHSKDISVFNVDVTQNPILSSLYGIKYTPTIIVFKAGKIIGQRRVGAASKETLLAYIHRSRELTLTKEKTEK